MQPGKGGGGGGGIQTSSPAEQPLCWTIEGIVARCARKRIFSLVQAAEAHSNSPMPHSTTSIQAFAAPSALSACDRSPLTSFSGPSLWSSLSFHPLLCEKDWFFPPVTPHPFSKKVCCETSRPATRRRTTEAAYRHVITRGLAAGSSFALAHCRRTLVLQAPSLLATIWFHFSTVSSRCPNPTVVKRGAQVTRLPVKGIG